MPNEKNSAASAISPARSAARGNSIIVPTKYSSLTPRLPNTSNFALPGLTAETAVIGMDLEGVALSSGAACSSGKVRSSRVLSAMGVPGELARAALRVSFGHESKESDVEEVLNALGKVAARRSRGAAA